MLDAFYAVMGLLGVPRLFYWLNRRRCIVLTYHNVLPDTLFDDTVHLGVSHRASTFDAQLALVVRRLGTTRDRCVVTFDDGYQNQLEIAEPVLARHGLRGIFFIAFQSMTSGRALAIDQAMMWVSYVPAGEYSAIGLRVVVEPASRAVVMSRIYERLLSAPDLWDVVERDLDAAFPFAKLTLNPELARLRFAPLRPADLRTLAVRGHDVAAHSWSHRPLGTLALDAQRADFAACADSARRHCNSPLFSYPFGGPAEVAPLTTELCAEYGFTAAYLNTPDVPASLGARGSHALPRLSLPERADTHVLDAKLSGFEHFCKRLLRPSRAPRTLART